MLFTRINARLSGPLAIFVEQMVGTHGPYETSSEYIRDLIRRDMERHNGRNERESIVAGYQDIAGNRFFASTGDFDADMKKLTEREQENWR